MLPEAQQLQRKDTCMTHKHSPQTHDFAADPYEIEIGGYVIFHRAGLLPHDRADRQALIEAANDYFWYAHLLERLNGTKPPWDRSSKDEATPSEVFYENAEWVGLARSVPRPRIGIEQRHFRLTPRADAANSRLHPNPNEAGSLAVVEVIKHPSNRWQVLHAEVIPAYRRRGVATKLYDCIEGFLATKLGPSGWLSEDAHRYWRARGFKYIDYYRQVDHLPGMWLSPPTLMTLRNIAVARMMDWSEDAKRKV
jgi:ribosomal protein S18 acetylase RimI-like enzyme